MMSGPSRAWAGAAQGFGSWKRQLPKPLRPVANPEHPATPQRRSVALLCGRPAEASVRSAVASGRSAGEKRRCRTRRATVTSPVELDRFLAELGGRRARLLELVD